MITVDAFFKPDSNLRAQVDQLSNPSFQINTLPSSPEGNSTGNEFIMMEFNHQLDDIKIKHIIDDYQHILCILNTQELMKYKYLIQSYSINFIVKPYTKEELLMRMESILLKHNNNDDVLSYKDIKVFYKKHTVYVKNILVDLSHLEYNILKYFIKNKSSVITKEQLIIDVWHDDPKFFKSDKVRVAIFRLKSKLTANGASEYIKAKTGVGYLLA